MNRCRRAALPERNGGAGCALTTGPRGRTRGDDWRRCGRCHGFSSRGRFRHGRGRLGDCCLRACPRFVRDIEPSDSRVEVGPRLRQLRLEFRLCIRKLGRDIGIHGRIHDEVVASGAVSANATAERAG